MNHWIENAIFYHIYPLGLCDAPRYHEDVLTHRIQTIKDWIPHIKKMGFTAVYFGPLFESSEHGYDTSDYREIDHRLGDTKDVKEICNTLHEEGIHIVFDGVFNHVGRSFWAFQDVIEKREASPYIHWFQNLRFDQDNPMQDGFTYDTWQGYYNLVKLNLRNEDVISYLLESIGMWMDEFHVDGIRLDAADCVDLEFFRRLKIFCKERNENFWLMGEIIHGDYTRWANPQLLDSVTNYECYKGLYSSHNDKNYFEIAHSLNRQFGKGGIYESLHLYNFVDNHDVNRIASTLKNKEDIRNVYTLLYTMPGIPSIYYGSEWGVEGVHHDGSDADIRPCLKLNEMKASELTTHIQKLNQIRASHPTLFYGTQESISIKNEQFVFARKYKGETIIIGLNVSDETTSLDIAAYDVQDVLTNTLYSSSEGMLHIELSPKSACILVDVQNVPNSEESIHMTSPMVEENQEEQPVMVEDTIQINEEVKSFVPVQEDVIPLGKYEHFKGKHYSVLYVGTHSETLEPYVVYRQLYGEERVWVRPLSMFTERVEQHGTYVPRFQYIGK